MTTYRTARRMAARLLRWELSWIGVEILGVMIGLGLMLGTEFDEHGGVVLLTVCAMSFYVRGRKHARTTRHI
jgi:hypothetical protein